MQSRRMRRVIFLAASIFVYLTAVKLSVGDGKIKQNAPRRLGGDDDNPPYSGSDNVNPWYSGGDDDYRWYPGSDDDHHSSLEVREVLRPGERLHPQQRGQRSSIHPQQRGQRSSIHPQQRGQRSSIHPQQRGQRSSIHPEQRGQWSSIHPQQRGQRSSIHPQQRGQWSSIHPQQRGQRSSIHPQQRGQRSSIHPQQRGQWSSMDPTLGHLLVEASLSPLGVVVWLNGQEVFKLLNTTLEWSTNPVRLHAGVHLLTLHQSSGKVMRAGTYLTWQPENSRQLREAIVDATEGRLLLFLGTPEFTVYLGQEVVELLVSMGSQFVNRLAKGESWCLLAQKGVGVLHEVLTTVHHSLGEDGGHDAPPTSLLMVVPLSQERVCGWYGVAGMQERAAFCNTYDGYGDFCSCHDPPWSPHPKTPMEYEMEEVIPVAIVTARRLPHVLRQVGQVWASPGGTNTPITIFVDGHNPEAQALAALLHLPVVQHHNPASKGSSARINEHIKFALKSVFEIYNTANLSVILEDDLQLAPDFIPYFHQTAPLLKTDPYLLFVNAFNYNSYAHTAHDPRRLYRAHGIPGYGWMTTRQGAADMLANWVPVTKTDAVWDWWVRAMVMGNRDMLLPEVPRTRHMGGGGTHVSGFDQLLYSSQPLNNLTNVTLDVESADEATYEDHIREEMKSAQVVTLTQHPCEVTPLPTHQTNKTFLLYIDQPDENKNSTSYQVVALCLGINDRDIHENLRMMVTFPFFGNRVYLVACPNSPYCHPPHRHMVYRGTGHDLNYAQNNPFIKPSLRINYAIRVPPQDPQQEFTLQNRQVVDYTIGD